MHADVIILGQDCDAFLLGYLFARRGIRTLVLGADKDDRRGEGRHLFVDADLARKFHPVSPPEEAVVQRHLDVIYWSPGEKHTLSVEKLPYLVFDAGLYRRFLELHGTRTGNLRVLRGYVPTQLELTRNMVSGVVLETGNRVGARLVVEAGDGGRTLTPTDVEGPHSPARFAGRISTVQKRVGAAASAWRIGHLTVRPQAGGIVIRTLRTGQEDVSVSAIVPGAVNARSEAVVARVWREAGLGDLPTRATFQDQVWLGPARPVPCAPGYLAVGRAAGHANPFVPDDLTPVFAGVYLAWVAAANAMEEADLTPAGLWDYPRAFATQQGQQQAWSWVMTRMLAELAPGVVDGLFGTGLLDPYVLSCLARNRLLVEDALDAMARKLRGLKRPRVLTAWLGAMRRAGRLAAAYAAVPSSYDAAAVRDWQEKIHNSW